MEPHPQPAPDGEQPAVPGAAPTGPTGLAAPTSAALDPAARKSSSNRSLWILGAVAVVIALTITIVLANGGGGRRWSQSVEDNFMAQCTATSGGYINTCTCVMHRLEGQYSEQDMAAIEAETASTGQAPDQFQQAAQAAVDHCR